MLVVTFEAYLKTDEITKSKPMGARSVQKYIEVKKVVAINKRMYNYVLQIYAYLLIAHIRNYTYKIKY